MTEEGKIETKRYEGPVDKLRWECDPKLFEFECTKDLAPLREFIGQERLSSRFARVKEWIEEANY